MKRISFPAPQRRMRGEWNRRCNTCDNIIHLALNLLRCSIRRACLRPAGGGLFQERRRSVMKTSKMIDGAGWMFGAGALALLLAAASQLVAG